MTQRVIGVIGIFVILTAVGCGVQSRQSKPVSTTQHQSNAEPALDTGGPTEAKRQYAVQEASEIPAGFPEHVTVQEALAVVSTLTLAGQGCGGMTWEGKPWSMYANDYKEQAGTPWFDKPISISATYAYGAEGHFLAAISLDQQEYRRNNRTQTRLHWTRDLSKER